MVCHLKDIELICVKCHAFHHIARTKAEVTKVQWDDLLCHFVKVNGCIPEIVDHWTQFEMRVFRVENEKFDGKYNEIPPSRDLINKPVRYTINPHLPFANEMMKKLAEQGLLYYPEKIGE
jgi:hypothetical protein